MLNAAQKKHFATFGYLVLRQVFSPTEIDAIRREADAILCRNRADKAFTGQKRQAMIPFFDFSLHPVSELIESESPRLRSLVARTKSRSSSEC